MQQQSRIQGLRTMPYEDYLQTPEWQEKREIALRLAEYRCQVCNSPDNLHVHHRTYERRGCEALADLTVLCKPCHELFHSISIAYKAEYGPRSYLTIKQVEEVWESVRNRIKARKDGVMTEALLDSCSIMGVKDREGTPVVIIGVYNIDLIKPLHNAVVELALKIELSQKCKVEFEDNSIPYF